MALIARAALAVFDPQRDPKVEEALELPNPGEMRENMSRSLRVAHLLWYLKSFTKRDHFPYALPISRLCADMERQGFLIKNPYDTEPRQADILAQSYWSAGGITSVQGRGDLWLSGILGAGLIIPSYGSATVAITGVPRGARKRAIGSGLVLDGTHILTAKHVIDGMVLDEAILTPTMAPPRSTNPKPHIKPPARKTRSVRIVDVHRSDEIDLAVVEVQPGDGHEALTPLAGVGFREPQWGDSTYVFGYPPSQLPDGIDGPNLIVQRGEVVNPEVQGYNRRPLFLYSAIARPGASGGPIVAQDGRVVGMVIEEGLSAGNSMGDERSDAEASEFNGFYLGIPPGDMMRELDKLGLASLLPFDPC